MDQYPKEFYTIALPWLASKILDKYGMSYFVDPETGKEYDFRWWMLWHVRQGHVHIWPDYKNPTGGMIARRINLHQVKRWKEYTDIELPYIHDPEGDGVWMDFLWAPGQKTIVLDLLASLGVDWGGWQHRKTMAPHIKLIKDLAQNPHFMNEREEATLI
jgi:hypothetical protein